MSFNLPKFHIREPEEKEVKKEVEPKLDIKNIPLAPPPSTEKVTITPSAKKKVEKKFLEQVEERIKKIGEYLEKFAQIENPEEENALKKMFLKPIRSLGAWLKEGAKPKTPEEYKALSQLGKLQENLQQFLFKTSTRKGMFIVAILMSLVAGIIALIKIHQHYHIFTRKTDHHNHNHNYH